MPGLEKPAYFFTPVSTQELFQEPFQAHSRIGWIEVICGSMFSGKTEELIRRIKRAKIAGQSYRIFKPSIDHRYDRFRVVSHDAQTLEATMIMKPSELLELSAGIDVLGIDEVQFFDPTIVDIVNHLASNGHRVILAGLDMDFRGQPFGAMPALLASAEYVSKLHAICVHCGNPASYTYRIHSDLNTILIGAKEAYEARCRTCFASGNQLPK